MPIELSREALLAYRNRRWDLVREAKEQFWAEETRARGPDAGFAAGEALWLHARAMDATWPSEESRRADFVIGGPGLEELFLQDSEREESPAQSSVRNSMSGTGVIDA